MSNVRQHLTSTALVVLVSEAEAAVSGVRARFDPSARLGVPAHVTLLFPFMPLSAVSEPVLASLQALFAGFASFTARFAAVRRWPNEAYLAPEPEAPFVALTRGIAARFPEYQPYEGRHTEIVPHLTIAQGSITAAERGAEEVSSVLESSGSGTRHLHRSYIAREFIRCLARIAHVPLCASCRLTPPSSGQATAGRACLRLPLMSNVRQPCYRIANSLCSTAASVV